MNKSLINFLDFVSLTHEVRAIKRSMWVKGEEQFENDSEHSFQVALCALYIIESQQLPLNPFRAMGLGLVHDIIEVHAGDTPIFGEASYLASKAEREATARQQLRTRWPELTLVHQLIDEYEARQTPEGRFVYALDKLLPVLNNYLDNGRNWKKNKVSLAQIEGAKADKVRIDPTINQYYEAIIEALKQRPDLFPTA